MYIVNSIILDQSFLQFLKWMIHQCHARIAIFLWTAFFTSLLMTGFNIKKRFPQGTILGSEKFAFSKVSYMQTNNIFSVRSVARLYLFFFSNFRTIIENLSYQKMIQERGFWFLGPIVVGSSYSNFFGVLKEKI